MELQTAKTEKRNSYDSTCDNPEELSGSVWEETFSIHLKDEPNSGNITISIDFIDANRFEVAVETQRTGRKLTQSQRQKIAAAISRLAYSAIANEIGCSDVLECINAELDEGTILG